MTTTLERPPARTVACKDCLHFRVHPFGSGTPWKRKTGCYHPDLMVQKQTEGYLKEQQVPGDPEVLNLRGDCPKFQARAPRGTWLQRVFAVLFS